MSKAVLVMDMPEKCSKCMFLYEFSGIKNCSLMNVMHGGASRLSQSNFTKYRHEKCPLHTVPEKKDEKSASTMTDLGWIGVWNACIDAIIVK